MNSIYLVVKLIGCLALLMFGMKTMSEGLQKMAGGQLRRVLGAMTKKRFSGLLTGAFITCAVQSSTATTVMTVSFVNAGLLSLTQAISVIMGANIGTTATGWIIALFGFQIKMSELIFPIFAIAIPFIFSSKSGRKSFGEFIYGFSFMFLGLAMLRENANDLLNTTTANGELFQTVLAAKIATFANWGVISRIIFLIIGAIMTMSMQSSVAVMAITMILCSTGSLDIYSGIALVLGENIGTTITSNIAALTGNMQSRRAALFHFLFNTFGVIWVLFVFKPFVDLICNVVGFDPANPDPIRITYVICAFHTSFNVCNVCILYGFIKYIEKLVCYILPSKEEEDEFRLKFISAGVMTTAELSIIEAYKETESYAERTERMFGLVKDLFNTTNEKDYNKLLSRIEKYEQICDNLEVEIGNYLNKISEGRLSASSKQKIFDIMREVSEIESIGDSCYNLSKHINSIHKEKRFFTDKQKENIEMMFELVEGALKNMVSQVRDKSIDTDSNISFNIETEINNLRANLKSQNAVDINDKVYDYKLGVWYMDIINECEKLGDYVINVVEARKEIKFV